MCFAVRMKEREMRTLKSEGRFFRMMDLIEKAKLDTMAILPRVFTESVVNIGDKRGCLCGKVLLGGLGSELLGHGGRVKVTKSRGVSDTVSDG